MIRTEALEINMGPQHPSTHGVLRLVLSLEGETVVDLVPDINTAATRDALMTDLGDAGMWCLDEVHHVHVQKMRG